MENCEGVTITGNQLKGIWDPPKGSFIGVGSGIRLSNTRAVSVTGNVSTNNAARGLSISGALSSDITVIGNQFSTNNGHGVFSSVGQKLYIKDNRIYENGLGNFSVGGHESNRIGENYVDDSSTVTTAAGITLPPGLHFITITGMGTINSISAANQSNQTVTLKFNGTGCIVAKNSTLHLQSQFNSTNNSTLTLVSDGNTGWWEVGRSVPP
jgi:hypothetical protein